MIGRLIDASRLWVICAIRNRTGMTLDQVDDFFCLHSFHLLAFSMLRPLKTPK